MQSLYNKAFKSRSSFRSPSCSICGEFRLPTFRSRSVSSSNDIAPPILYAEILKGCAADCSGCSLLRDIIHYYNQQDDRRNVWVSLIPPSAFSSQYQLLLNGTGALEIFRSADNSVSILPAIPALPHISGGTSSGYRLGHARKWLQQCLQDHKRCQLSGPQAAPSRLLDLKSVNRYTRGGTVRLVELNLNSVASYQYACLSHCWGTGPIVTTTSSNLSSHRSAIPFNSLPKTFQEAIIVTLELGVFLLWIDSLCIIQDSASDWDEESKNMASIYRNSRFTIAASRASGSDQGCFSETPVEYVGHELCTRDSATGTEYSFWVRKPINHSTWPLLKRGWVFQERLLSRRVLHFTNEELVWECKETTACECSHALTAWTRATSLDSKSQYHGNIESATRSRLSDAWRDMVTRYTAMNLTYDKDIFPALSGLAKDMEAQARGLRGYCAGTWEEKRVIDLLWRQLSSKSGPRHWRAPSWSWASTASRVGYESMGGRRLSTASINKLHARVLDARQSQRGPDPHGEITFGSITLRGRLAAATPYNDKGRIDGHYIEVNGQRGVAPTWDDPMNAGARNSSRNLGSKVYLLKMATTNSRGRGEPDTYRIELVCLVLTCINDTELKFERVGFLSTYWPEDREHWFDSPETTITLL